MLKTINKPIRDSNLELYRIVVMFLIVMHHYVVNSGLTTVMMKIPMASQSIFLYLFGMWGKTGINCFVLITGYFMCKQDISIFKFLRLIFEVWFYSFVLYLVFSFFGYYDVSIKGVLFEPLAIFRDLTYNFIACFIVFYLFIPIVNILIRNLDNRKHLILVLLCLFFFSILPSFRIIEFGYSYVSWFVVIYLIGAYLRLYMDDLFENFQSKIKISQLRFWSLMSLAFVSLSVLSVLSILWLGKPRFVYQLVSDSNKILAILTAVSLFMLFKNLKIKHNKFINTVAASTFGVLLIHANSDTMRQWLWADFGKNVEQFGTSTLVLHAIGLCVLVFVVCVVIDYLMKRFIEYPLFRMIDRNLQFIKRLSL